MGVVTIPEDFGLVAIVVVVSYVVNHLFMPFGVVSARKKYKVDYPDLYATSENCGDKDAIRAFNCVQRAHQNSLEHEGVFLALLIAGGLAYPRTMALLGTAFLASRVLYFVGYSQRAKNRMVGSLVGEAVLVGMCGVCVTAGLAPLRATLGM